MWCHRWRGSPLLRGPEKPRHHHHLRADASAAAAAAATLLGLLKNWREFVWETVSYQFYSHPKSEADCNTNGIHVCDTLSH